MIAIYYTTDGRILKADTIEQAKSIYKNNEGYLNGVIVGDEVGQLTSETYYLRTSSLESKLVIPSNIHSIAQSFWWWGYGDGRIDIYFESESALDSITKVKDMFPNEVWTYPINSWSSVWFHYGEDSGLPPYEQPTEPDPEQPIDPIDPNPDQPSDPITPPSEGNLGIEHVLDDTSFSTLERYSAVRVLSVTDNIIEEAVKDPLDNLNSPYQRLLYMREWLLRTPPIGGVWPEGYIEDGEGIKSYHYIQIKNADNWSFGKYSTNENKYIYPSFYDEEGKLKSQHKYVNDYWYKELCSCGIVSFGSITSTDVDGLCLKPYPFTEDINKLKKEKDSTVLADPLKMEDYFIINVNSELRTKTSQLLDRSIYGNILNGNLYNGEDYGIAKYISDDGSNIWSPTDDSYHNYLVFEGDIKLQKKLPYMEEIELSGEAYHFGLRNRYKITKGMIGGIYFYLNTNLNNHTNDWDIPYYPNKWCIRYPKKDNLNELLYHSHLCEFYDEMGNIMIDNPQYEGLDLGALGVAQMLVGGTFHENYYPVTDYFKYDYLKRNNNIEERNNIDENKMNLTYTYAAMYDMNGNLINNYRNTGEGKDTISYLPLVECELKIGDFYLCEIPNTDNYGIPKYQWYHKNNLPKYPLSNGGFSTTEIRTFTIGVDYNSGDDLFHKKFSFVNTMSPLANVDEKGIGIEIPQLVNGTKLKGKLEFRILGPVNLEYDNVVRHSGSFWKHSSYSVEKHYVMDYVLKIIISSFKVKLVSGNLIEEVDTNKDLVTECLDSSVNPSTHDESEVTFNILTQPTGLECKDAGIATNVNRNCAYVLEGEDFDFLKSIEKNGQTKKPEEWWVDTYFTQYSENRIAVEASLRLTPKNGASNMDFYTPKKLKLKPMTVEGFETDLLISLKYNTKKSKIVEII